MLSRLDGRTRKINGRTKNEKNKESEEIDDGL